MNIEGKWYNELGSEVLFSVDGQQLTGSYTTKVGNATGSYPLAGQLNTSTETGQAIGFVVVWQNEYKDSNSVTSWSGQAQEVDGEEVIATTWLLTSETDSDDDWHSTIVGNDRFTRTPQKQKLTEKSVRSFPKGM